ncbi:hypothetical protein NA78x_003354 [Anatilimnocola sp. NA78]|uniref:hypothetical protein n=1 Tax=Anatilimnocola sp. NA78 TaxID=3415683 RepID=UPI003CE5A7BA
MPYALIHNSLDQLWAAAELVRVLPRRYDDDGRMSPEDFQRACDRLMELLGNVADYLTSAHDLLGAAIRWFALGSEQPLPRLKYQALYRHCDVLRASTYHEFAYELAEAVVVDLGSQSSAPYSGLSNSKWTRLKEKQLLTESFDQIAKDKWHWPLLEAYHKRHRQLIRRLRREFLRAWAQGQFERAPSEEVCEDLILKDSPEKRRKPCYDRDAYFTKLNKENGMKPAAIRDKWNSSRELRQTICLDRPNQVKLATVVKALKRFE